MSSSEDFQVIYKAAAHYWLEKVAEKRGRLDAAREEFRTALKLNPSSKLAKQALEESN